MSVGVGEEKCNDEVDPRIQGELERLNNASHEINIREKEHEDAQELFRHTLAESAADLKLLYDKLGKRVDQARPYYETSNQTEHVHCESEQAAARYERACDNYAAAKDMVKKAEERLSQGKRFLDSACQEMLNHATVKVMEAYQEKVAAKRIHLEVSQAFNEMQEKRTRLHKELKSVINKTRSYFELKEKYSKVLEDHKKKVLKLHHAVLIAKQEYHAALRNLEEISDSIHEQRNNETCLLEPRGQGVGAENPDQKCSFESSWPSDTHRSTVAKATLELDHSMKPLIKLEDSSLKQSHNESTPDGSQELFSEISVGLTDSDSDTCELSLGPPVTPPPLQKESTVMETKLFVSPPTPENSEDDTDTEAIRLEKWFCFSPPRIKTLGL